MSFPFYLILWLAVGFLAGSIPFGWIVTRAKGIDIRKIGSGNIGMTNVWRAMGWQWGLTVLILDALKGYLPLLSLSLCLARLPEGFLPPGWQAWLMMLVGITAILGHTFTPWLKFRGGKGIATGLGVIIALMGIWALAPLACFALIAATTRIVALGSIMAALLAGATILTVPDLKQYWLVGIAMPLLVLYTHRSNIQRLIAGTEHRIGSGKGKPPTKLDGEPDESEAQESAEPSNDQG